jgi:hypothetical protein
MARVTKRRQCLDGVDEQHLAPDLPPLSSTEMVAALAISTMTKKRKILLSLPHGLVQ